MGRVGLIASLAALASCGGEAPGMPASWLEVDLDGEVERLGVNATYAHNPPWVAGSTNSAVQMRASGDFDGTARTQAMLLVHTSAARFLDYGAEGGERFLPWELWVARGSKVYRSRVHNTGPVPEGEAPSFIAIDRDGLIVEGRFAATVRGIGEADGETLVVEEGRFRFFRQRHLDFTGRIDLVGGLFSPWREGQNTPAELKALGADPVSDAIRALTPADFHGTWQLFRYELYDDPGEGDDLFQPTTATTKVYTPRPGVLWRFSPEGIDVVDEMNGNYSFPAPTVVHGDDYSRLDLPEGPWGIPAILYWSDDQFVIGEYELTGQRHYLERVE